MDAPELSSHGAGPNSVAPPAARTIEQRFAAAAARVAALSGWRRWLLGIGTGAASVLALPPFFVWPVLLVTLPLLLWLASPAADTQGEAIRGAGRFDIDRRRLLRGASAGWLFGYGFHVAGLYWLREAFLITGGGLGQLWPLGVLGLPAGLALFHALAGAAAAAVVRPGLARVLAFAIALGITEWLRGNILTGFPWNVLGMALTQPLVLMQSSGLIGIYGLTAVTVLALAGPLAVLAAGNTRNPRTTAAALLMVPLVAMMAYGSWRLSAPPPGMVEAVRLRLVQPGIDQRDKWRAEKQPEILARHLELTGRNARGEADGLAGITHVIWPEAAMPFLPLQRPNVMAAIADALPSHVHLLAGIVRVERRHGAQGEPSRDSDAIYAYNSLAVFDGEGRPVAVYDKTHLVPFGEYLPFQNLLESIGLQTLTRQRGGFTSGPTPRPLLDVGALAGIAPLICYEGIFPGVGQKSVGRPSVYLNVTNDGWFGNSTGPRQHFHQARLRSVEEGVPLARVANNGISALFDPYGREIARIELDVAGVVDTQLPKTIARPLYARLGDITFGGLLIGLVLTFLYLTKTEM